MKNHQINYSDLIDYVAERDICSAAGRGQNKRLIMYAKASDKSVWFKVVNYMGNYQKEHENIESAIEDYNEQ